MLASGGSWWDGSIRLWNATTGTHEKTLSAHSGWVLSLTFSPDGRTLASGSEDESICLWNVRTGQRNRKITGHTGGIRGVAFSPDGSTLASGSEDETIRLWDVVSGSHKRKLTGHTGGVRSVAFSPDSTVLASGGWDNNIYLWDIKAGGRQARIGRTHRPRVKRGVQPRWEYTGKRRRVRHHPSVEYPVRRQGADANRTYKMGF